MSPLDVAKPADPRPLRRASILGNMAASFGGQAAIAALGVVCTPIYIRWLGREAFGLIGFSITLQALLRVFDLGLTPTVIRETARSSAGTGGELRSLIRTYQRVFALLGLVIAAGLVLVSSGIAGHWLHHQQQQVAVPTVRLCVLFIGVQCGVSWLSGFYQSALQGLERQATYNLLRTIEATCSWLGALVVLRVVALRVELMFAWQLLVAAAAATVYGVVLHAGLPARVTAPVFRLAYLRRIRGFAAGMAGITIAGAVLSNMDKLVLSKMLPLEALGDYSVAFIAAATIFAVLVLPISSVMFPRYAALIAAGDGAGVRGLYHLTMQMVAVLTVPAAVVLFWFTGDLVQFWTGNRDVAAQAARVVPWLAAGLMFNALAVPPYTLQIAHGGTAAVLKINALLLAVFAPLLLVLARRFGAVGAAANFMAMQATLLLLMLPVTHVRLMRAEGWRAAAADLVPGAVVGVLAAVALPWLPWASWPLGVRVVVAVVTWVGLAGVLAVASARVREAWRTRWVALLGMWRA